MNLYDIANQLDAAIRGGVYNGYGPRLIPHPLDEPVEELLRAIRSAGPAAAEILGSFDGGLAYVLMVTRSGRRRWRSGGPRRRRWSWPCSDWGWQSPATTERSSWSCRFRGARPSCSATTRAATFERVAAELPEAGRDDLLMFTRRRPADQTLSAMGYSEGADQDGFRYHRNW